MNQLLTVQSPAGISGRRNRGLAEGSVAPIESREGWKWGEVVRNTTESFGSAYSTGFFVVMNRDKWGRLPGDIQKIIERVNAEWIEKTGRLWDESDRSGRAFTLKLGNRAIPLGPEENRKWAQAVQPILLEYVQKTKAKGLPGDEALKFCLDFLKKT